MMSSGDKLLFHRPYSIVDNQSGSFVRALFEKCQLDADV